MHCSVTQVVELFSNVTWTKADHSVHEFEIVENWRTPWTGIFINLLIYMLFTVKIFSWMMVLVLVWWKVTYLYHLHIKCWDNYCLLTAETNKWTKIAFIPSSKQFCGSVVASTLPVPSGIFIPVFKIGAALGRIVGEAMAVSFPNGLRYGGHNHIIIPGKSHFGGERNDAQIIKGA